MDESDNLTWLSFPSIELAVWKSIGYPTTPSELVSASFRLSIDVDVEDDENCLVCIAEVYRCLWDMAMHLHDALVIEEWSRDAIVSIVCSVPREVDKSDDIEITFLDK